MASVCMVPWPPRDCWCQICRLIGRYDQKTNGRRFIRAVSKRRGNVPAETITAEVRARPPGVPAGALVRKRISAQTRTARARAMTAATARHADARLTAVPAKVATCLGTSHALGIPDASRGRFVVPGSRPTRPRRSPRAGEPGRRAGCLRRARGCGAPVSPRRGEERLAIVPRVRRVGRETPSVVQKNALGKRQGRQGVRPRTVLATVHGAAPAPPLPRVRPRVLRAVRRDAAAARPTNRRARDEPRRGGARDGAGCRRARVRTLLRTRLRGGRAAAKREGTREGTRVASVASEASEASSSSHVEEHRNTAFSVSGETTSFGSAETRARSTKAFLSAPFPEKSIRRRKKRNARFVEGRELGSVRRLERKPRRRGHFKRSVGDAAPEPADGVPQREDAHRGARRGTSTAAGGAQEQTRQTDDSYDDDDDDDGARGVAGGLRRPSRAVRVAPGDSRGAPRASRDGGAAGGGHPGFSRGLEPRSLRNPEPLSGDDGDVFAGESDSPNDAAAPRGASSRGSRGNCGNRRV